MSDAQQSIDSEGGYDAYRVKRAAERQARAAAEAAYLSHEQLLAAGYKWDGMDGYYR